MKLPPVVNTGIAPVDRAQRQARQLARYLLQQQGGRRVEWDPALERYQADLVAYCRERLGVALWPGGDRPGQLEIARDIQESARLQLQGLPAPRVFRVKGGHGCGKTVLLACVLLWFYECYPRSVTLTTAPTLDQVKKLLWKDVRKLAPADLSGELMPDAPELYMDRERYPNWFAIGRSTNDSGGQGTAKAHGQHERFMLHLYDEAEGIPAFQYAATDAMMTGGTVQLWLLSANPATQFSAFHQLEGRPGVRTYQLSLLDFPNVREGREVVPGGTSREWVNAKIVEWCDVVQGHNEDKRTFAVPWEVRGPAGTVYPPGTVFQPKEGKDFTWRVLGVAADVAANAFVSYARFEAAQARPLPARRDLRRVQLGVDCARFGTDAGKVYRLLGGLLEHCATLSSQDTDAYVAAAERAALEAHALGAEECQVAVDGTGGYGAGVVDGLRKSLRLREAFGDGLVVVEVPFGAAAHDAEEYDNVITELYAHAAEALKGVTVAADVPNELKVDLTNRLYGYVNRSGQTKKALEDKEKFRARMKKLGQGARSCDDGDGAVLALAPAFVLEHLKGAPLQIFV